MKIKKLNLLWMRNEEHLRFHEGVVELIAAHGAAALGIDALAGAYSGLLPDEREAISVVLKSATTEDIREADGRRDDTYRGVTDIVRANTHHYEDDLRDAAERLAVIFDSHGNLAPKPYDEETAAISSLVDQLSSAGAADVAALGIAGWVAELAARNERFIELQKTRYSEEADRTQLKMKEVRAQMDEAYRGMITMIEALATVNGPAAYQTFANELNARVNDFAATLAQRKGRNAAS